MRAVHELAAASGRDIILGSTSITTPSDFIAQLRKLAKVDDINLDDVEV